MDETVAQELILSVLVNNDGLSRRIAPHIKTEHFEAGRFGVVGSAVLGYINQYAKVPNQTECLLEISKATGLSREEVNDSQVLVSKMYTDMKQQAVEVNDEWFLKNCQEYCLGRSTYLGIMKAMDVIEGKKVDGRVLERGAIPKILEDSLAFSFDHRVGHSYFDDSAQRFQFYHSKHEAIPSALKELNKVLGNEGYIKKTVTVFAAPPNTGKSAILTSEATDMMMRGHKVLYISLEMAEERVAQRIDANIIDVAVNDLKQLSEKIFTEKIETAKNTTEGNIYFIEYATGSAGASQFRVLMNDLRVKKKFVPDIVFIDYLNICSTARMKQVDNMYLFGKLVAEDLCAFAKHYNIPVVSACQINRGGAEDSDYGLEDIADSYGIAMTVDCMIGLIITEQLEQMGQIKFKQLRNRLHRVDFPRWFVANFDRNKMRFTDAKNDGAVDTGKPTQNPTYNAPVPSNLDDDPGYPFNAFSSSSKKPALNTESWKF